MPAAGAKELIMAGRRGLPDGDRRTGARSGAMPGRGSHVLIMAGGGCLTMIAVRERGAVLGAVPRSKVLITTVWRACARW